MNVFINMRMRLTDRTFYYRLMVVALTLAVTVVAIGAQKRPASNSDKGKDTTRTEYVFSLAISGENTKLDFGVESIAEICVDDKSGDIFTFHDSSKTVRIWDKNGNFIFKFALRLRGKRIPFPSFAIDAQANIYIPVKTYMSQRGGKQKIKYDILIFDYAGRPLGKMDMETPPDGRCPVPAKIKTAPGDELCILDGKAPRAVFYDMSGKYKREIVVEERHMRNGISKEYPVTTFTDVAFSANGEFFFLSNQLTRIFKLDKDGKLISKFGKKGGKKGTMSQPRAIAVDADSNEVHVLDSMRMTVIVFDSEGKFKFEWSKSGHDDGMVYYPNKLYLDSKSRAYVSDMTKRLQVFEKKITVIQAQKGNNTGGSGKRSNGNLEKASTQEGTN